MAKDTFYFSHDYNTRTDVKVKRLLSKHGMTGYGIFWAIIEDLYNNANALPTDYESIAFDLRCDCGMVKSIINDFDLFRFDKGTFGSISIERRLDERNSKSTKARESALKRWSKCERNANAMRTDSEGNAIKESKGKDIKDIKDIKESKGNKGKDIDAVSPLYYRFVELFMIEYNKATGLPYQFNGVDGKAVKALITKITGTCKAKISGATEDDIFNTFEIFITRLPEWYRKNAFDLKTLAGNYDKIMGQLNIKHNGINIQSSEDDSERFIRAHEYGKKFNGGADTPK